MRTTIVKTLRRGVSVVWTVAVIGLVALVAWSHLSSLMIIGGGSMEPAVPRGSLISPTAVDPAQVGVNDTLTVRADNGVVVTHRVARVIDLPEGRLLELKGDANLTPDPELVPARAVVGRVDYHVPYAGYLLTLITMPSGLVFVITTLGALLVLIWLLEDLESRLPRPVRSRATAKAPRGAQA